MDALTTGQRKGVPLEEVRDQEASQLQEGISESVVQGVRIGWARRSAELPAFRRFQHARFVQVVDSLAPGFALGLLASCRGAD